MHVPDLNKLVDAKTLLEILFEEKSRPSLRWLRGQQKAKAIPFIKWGRLVRFDPEEVAASIAKKNTVKAK